MRLWHQKLIPYLPDIIHNGRNKNQLGGQHTEIRMMLAIIKKHGKINHSTVNYVNDYSVSCLKAFGLLVIFEMKERGFKVNPDIYQEYYNDSAIDILISNEIIFKEHDDKYFIECLRNLREKGIEINI